MENRASINAKKFVLEIGLIPASTEVSPSSVELRFISVKSNHECCATFYTDGSSEGALTLDRTDPISSTEFNPAENVKIARDFINGNSSE